MGGKVGARRAIFFAISVYLFVSIWAAFIDNKTEFLTLAIIVGLVQGGIQAMSRSYYAKIIPVDKSAECFDFTQELRNTVLLFIFTYLISEHGNHFK